MNQDDETSRDRAWYASKAAALEGRRVLEIVYWDVHNFADEPRTWDYGDWHHAVMGVDLITDGGPSCVQWTRACSCTASVATEASGAEPGG